jgi:hypothetical protein
VHGCYTFSVARARRPLKMYFLFPPLFGRCQLVSYSMCCTAAAKARSRRFQLVRAHNFFPQCQNQTNTQAIGGSRCQMYHVVVPETDLSLLDRGLLHRFSFFSFLSPEPTLSDLFVPWLTWRLAHMVCWPTAVLCRRWGYGRLSRFVFVWSPAPKQGLRLPTTLAVES